MSEALDNKTKDQLQELMREFGLPVRENKPALIERLWAKYCALAHDIDHCTDDDDAQLMSALIISSIFMQSAHQYREAACSLRMKGQSTTSAIKIYIFGAPCNVNKLNALITFISVH